MVRAAILSAAMCTMASDMIIVPILDLLYSAFSEYSVTVVALAYNIAGFAFIPASLLTPYLCRKYSMRKLMLAGTLLCLIGGGLGGLSENLYYIIGMHFVEGIGAGFCTNIIPIYIARLCTDERDVLRMDAWNGTVGTLLGFLVTICSGQAASLFGWQKAYFVYFLELTVLFLQICFLPDTEPEKADVEGNEELRGKTLTPRVLRWLAEVFVFALFINLMWTHQAGYLAENGLGGADVSGIASGIIQIGGFLASFAIAPVMQRVKTYYQNVSFALFILSAAVMLNAGTAIHFYIASMIWGLGQGLIYPYLWAEATLIAPNERTVSSVISWTTIGWYLAVGMTTIVYARIAAVFHNESSTFAMHVVLAAFVILSVYRFVAGSIEKRRGIL